MKANSGNVNSVVILKAKIKNEKISKLISVESQEM
jgi:hypothetical protein